MPPSAEVASASSPRRATDDAAATGGAGRPAAGSDSDTEEDEEAVPGTPPDAYPSKRACTGSPGRSFSYGGAW
jgi:hypothetical protein